MRHLHSTLLLLSCIAPLGALRAQSEATPTTPTRKSWRPTLVLGAEVEGDNNVFLLSAGKKRDVAAPSPGQIISGRFNDMERASDLIGTVGLGLELKGPGLTGRPLTVGPSVEYARYVFNTVRSHVVAGFDLRQELPHQGRFRLGATVTPDQFTRNYLFDAIDGNVDGVITADERRYAPGRSFEADLGGDYRHRVSKSAGLWLLAGGGYSIRRFDAPHEDRDLDGPTGTLAIQFDRGRGLEVGLRYEVAGLTAPVTTRVVLLNEPDFGQDLNGDLDAVDLNVRRLTPVDRSRTEQAVAADLEVGIGKRTRLGFVFTHRWRSFSSDETYDVTNRGRRDRREEFGATMVNRLSRRVRLRTGAEFGAQRLTRDLDTAGSGEIGDYSRARFIVGLSCECLRRRAAGDVGQ